MRHENWPVLLAHEIDKAEREAFQWGKNDCCLFTADIVLAITGEDYATEYRGLYDTEASAYEVLGIKTIEEMVSHQLGKAINIKMAQRGDVVLGIFDDRQTIGICIGAKTAFKTPDGLIQINTLNCEKAWRVG